MPYTVLVVGGGLTGLVTAERMRAEGHQALVLEKEATPGGACRTEERGPYNFDYTGHLLHVARDETREYLDRLGVWSRLTGHDRRAAIFIGGAITPYPIQIHTWGLPPEIRRDCLLGFIEAWAAQRPDPANFYQWVLDRFGEGLGRHFFFPYNEKLFRARSEANGENPVSRRRTQLSPGLCRPGSRRRVIVAATAICLWGLRRFDAVCAGTFSAAPRRT